MSFRRNDFRPGTPTSSSGNESISSGSPSSPSQVSASWANNTLSTSVTESKATVSDTESDTDSSIPDEEDVPPSLPHRVIKLRRLLFEAYHPALTILHETKPHAVSLTDGASSGRPKREGVPKSVKLDVREPWMRLSRTVGALKGAIAALKDGDIVCSLCVAVLRVIIRERIILLACDKAYVKSLARNEAKAIPSLLKSWSKIPETMVADDDGTVTELLHDALDSAIIIVLRLAHHALQVSPGDGLDLSSLGVPPSVLDHLNISALCEVLGIARGDISKLDLSQNGWRRLPDWLPFPFPKVHSLDLTNNEPLAHLPLSLLHLNLITLHIRGTKISNTPHGPHIWSINPSTHFKGSGRVLDPSRSSNPSSTPQRMRGPPTLVHIILHLYMTLLRRHYPPSALSDLPPHIVHLLSETYRCELCYQYQYPDSATWLEREEEWGWLAIASEVKVVAVKGRVCVPCEGKFLAIGGRSM